MQCYVCMGFLDGFSFHRQTGIPLAGAFYSSLDDETYFPRCLLLFAIIPNLNN